MHILNNIFVLIYFLQKKENRLKQLLVSELYFVNMNIGNNMNMFEGNNFLKYAFKGELKKIIIFVIK